MPLQNNVIEIETLSPCAATLISSSVLLSTRPSLVMLNKLDITTLLMLYCDNETYITHESGVAGIDPTVTISVNNLLICTHISNILDI